MAAKKKLRRSPVDLRDRKALMEFNPAPEEILQVARENKAHAELNFGLGDSVITSWIYSKCHHHIPTTAIPTAAVTLLGDGSAMLLYNPYFFADLGPDGVKSVLFHEARHLIERHLLAEPHLRADQRWTIATESCINHVMMTRLKTGLPEVEVEVVDPKTGAVVKNKQKTGVDPKEVFKRYEADLKEQGLTPVDYANFIRTNFSCYTELCRMKGDPNPSKANSGECIHQEGDGDGSDDQGQVPMDQETADAIGKQVLHNVMQAATSGNERAREELLELADRTEGVSDRVSKIWGDLGLARLRGETPAVRRVDFWKQWLNNTLASKLKDGEALQYNKKRGAIDLQLGIDPMLMRRGEEEEKVVLIALDTSGSMGEEVVDYLTKLVGYTDGVEDHWLSFDGVVMPFVKGERVYGGGGTNFGNVMDYVEGRLEVNGAKLDQHPDAVIMLTDGGALPIRPQQPDKWIWLITDGGSDDWIRAQSDPMDSYQIRTGDGL